jgi:hypothetical protein
MKSKWRLWSGPTFAVVVVAWLVLSYVFMWPPIVRNIHNMAGALGNDDCIHPLKQIDAAINQWAIDNGMSNGARVTLDQLKLYIRLNSKGEIPGCPQGGKYSVTVVGAKPTCSLGTNTDMTRFRVHYFYWDWLDLHRIP